MEPDEETGTTIIYWASDEIFETTTYSLETITNRFREMAFLNKGLEIVVRDERASAEDLVDAVEDATIDAEIDQVGADAIKRGVGGGIERVFKYDRGLVDYVEHLNRRKPGGESPRSSPLRRTMPVRAIPASKSPCNVTSPLHRVGAHLC